MRIPYGFIMDDDGAIAVQEKTAECVLFIFHCYLAGASLGKIAELLYSRQIPSPSGNPKWTRAAIDKLLSNSKYIMIVGFDTFVDVQFEKEKRCNVDYDKVGAPRKQARYVSPEILCI